MVEDVFCAQSYWKNIRFFRDFIDLLTIFVYINIRREDWSVINLGDLFTERELSLYQTVVGIYGAHLGFGHTQILDDGSQALNILLIIS